MSSVHADSALFLNVLLRAAAQRVSFTRRVSMDFAVIPADFDTVEQALATVDALGGESGAPPAAVADLMAELEQTVPPRTTDFYHSGRLTAAPRAWSCHSLAAMGPHDLHIAPDDETPRTGFSGSPAAASVRPARQCRCRGEHRHARSNTVPGPPSATSRL